MAAKAKGVSMCGVWGGSSWRGRRQGGQGKGGECVGGQIDFRHGLEGTCGAPKARPAATFIPTFRGRRVPVSAWRLHALLMQQEGMDVQSSTPPPCRHRRRTGHRPSARVLRSSRRRRSGSESLQPRGAPSLTGGLGARNMSWNGCWAEGFTPRYCYFLLLGRQTWAAQNTPPPTVACIRVEMLERARSAAGRQMLRRAAAEAAPSLKMGFK